MANNYPKKPTPRPPDAEAAADAIRQKVDQIYAEEPSATDELAEAAGIPHRSRHQQFMYQLSQSGEDLATIQTKWHEYYQGLSDREKHQVWQEFYESQPVHGQHDMANPVALAEHKTQAARPEHPSSTAGKLRKRSSGSLHHSIKHKVTAGGKLKAKHHLQSLLFGLGLGLVVVMIFLFSFFNEVIIAPFIQPSRTSTATPIIVNSSTVAASSTPEVIIPKINVQIPVDYSQKTTNEAQIENALENGVVHYPTTALPGQLGNTAFFGHSSNNIFNRGKYKFAFVLLHTLVPGDTFYLTYNKKVYVYKVVSKKVVEPTQVSVLDPVPGQSATATLITCDPPGTSLHRLVVVGQQISPDPVGNTQSTATPLTSSSPEALPGNGPTLLTRTLRTPLGKTIAIVILVAAFVGIFRWMTKPARSNRAR